MLQARRSCARFPTESLIFLCTDSLLSIQPVTEVSTRLVLRSDNFATFMCRFSENLSSLNLLEPSDPIWDSTGMALPLPVYIRGHYIYTSSTLYVCICFTLYIYISSSLYIYTNFTLYIYGSSTLYNYIMSTLS